MFLKLQLLVTLTYFFHALSQKSINSHQNTKSRSFVMAEKSLIEKLLTNYDKNSRPSDTIEVRFSMYLNQIVNLIERDQSLVINVFLDHEWNDSRLTWEPKDWNNISLLRINSDYLWTYIRKFLIIF